MKIEKISDNQIRCTLNRDDLVDRQLRISELAYGTEKAKALFREMMQQASNEFGFEAEDIPLMIEAIPVSQDCLILVITKVEDPDELDTRFSKFSPDQTDETEFDDSESNYVDEIINCFDQINDLINETNINDENTETMSPLDKKGEHAHKDITLRNDFTKVFTFKSLDDISLLAAQIRHLYNGVNSVYKNPSNHMFYLCISKSEHSPEEFNKICNIITEYGTPERTMYASNEYFKEHFLLIVKDNAIQVLASL